jgi:hypothetical protein
MCRALFAVPLFIDPPSAVVLQFATGSAGWDHAPAAIGSKVSLPPISDVDQVRHRQIVAAHRLLVDDDWRTQMIHREIHRFEHGGSTSG